MQSEFGFSPLEYFDCTQISSYLQSKYSKCLLSPAGTCNLLPTPRGTLGSCSSYQITEGTSCTMGCESTNLNYYFLVGWAQATCSLGGVLTTAPDFICTRMFQLICQTSRNYGGKGVVRVWQCLNDDSKDSIVESTKSTCRFWHIVCTDFFPFCSSMSSVQQYKHLYDHWHVRAVLAAGLPAILCVRRANHGRPLADTRPPDPASELFDMHVHVCHKHQSGQYVRSQGQ
jgi:hypothetical protein